jgi:hypothetical protein
MEVTLKKIMIKQFDNVMTSILDDFIKNMIVSDESLTEEQKTLFKDKVEVYKTKVKEGIKNDNKKKKREKGIRKPTRYNMYMAEKMAEFKKNESTLSNNEKFAKIASQWQDDKATWGLTKED